MNIYLEKIASSVLGNIAKSALGVAKDGIKAGVKSVGKNLHHATGGAYVDYAVSKGITDPMVLSKLRKTRDGFAMDMKHSPEFKKKLKDISVFDDKATKAEKLKANSIEYINHTNQFHGKGNDFDKLQEQTRRARIKTVAVGGAGLYGYSKLKERASEINNRSTIQYAY